jgi:hypothetical protein
MPMHDWTLVPDGIYHAFHVGWINSITTRLNAGVLPNDLYALPEQVSGGFTPDVLALHTDEPEGTGGGGPAVQARPQKRFASEAELYRGG